MTAAMIEDPHALPIGSVGTRASGFWGVLCLILTEASIFVYLLFAYFYIAVRGHAAWPPSGPPDLTIDAPNNALIVVSAIAVWWAERSVRRGARLPLIFGLAIGLVLGAAFLALQVLEWTREPFSLFSDPYGSLYMTTTGFHVAHVAVGVIVLAALLLWSALGYFAERRHAAVTIGALYWYFCVVVSLAVFFCLDITPYFG